MLALSLLSKPIIFELDTSKNNRDIKFLLEAVKMSLSILLWYEKAQFQNFWLGFYVYSLKQKYYNGKFGKPLNTTKPTYQMW